MDQDAMIDDIVKMLDSGMADGIGHVNIEIDQKSKTAREIQTFGSTDCSRTPLACSVPTLHQGLDQDSDKSTTELE